jgi:hypothetical protein
LSQCAWLARAWRDRPSGGSMSNMLDQSSGQAVDPSNPGGIIRER